MKTFCWVIEDNFRPKFGKTDEIWGATFTPYSRTPPGRAVRQQSGLPRLRDGPDGGLCALLRNRRRDVGRGKARPAGVLPGRLSQRRAQRPGPGGLLLPLLRGQGQAAGHRFRTRAAGIPGAGKVRAGRRGGTKPRDGYFVAFWRILLEYPEILAWEMLWTRSMREHYAAIHERVKSVRPDVQVGWHIWHNISFSPFYARSRTTSSWPNMPITSSRAIQQLRGERMVSYLESVARTSSGRSQAEMLQFESRIMDISEAPLERLAGAGLSADYVYRDTRRALDDVAGTKTVIWPGIDIDVPTPRAKCTPESVRAATAAALRAGRRECCFHGRTWR